MWDFIFSKCLFSCWSFLALRLRLVWLLGWLSLQDIVEMDNHWGLGMRLNKTIYKYMKASISEVSVEDRRKLGALPRDPSKTRQNPVGEPLRFCFVGLVVISAHFLSAIAIYIQRHWFHSCIVSDSEIKVSSLFGKIYKVIVEGNSGGKADLSRGVGESLFCSSQLPLFSLK